MMCDVSVISFDNAGLKNIPTINTHLKIIITENYRFVSGTYVDDITFEYSIVVYLRSFLLNLSKILFSKLATKLE